MLGRTLVVFEREILRIHTSAEVPAFEQWCMRQQLRHKGFKLLETMSKVHNQEVITTKPSGAPWQGTSPQIRLA